MKISDILKQKTTLSLEVFPPKEDKPMEPLRETLSRLYGLAPDFISCTYGAGGTNKGRNGEVCAFVKQSGHEIMTHFTCIGQTRDDVRARIGEYRALGVENALILRGDFPEGRTDTGGDFAHSDALIAFIRSEFPDLCMAAAGYPEKHIAAPSLDADISHLRAKQENGARFVMTQLCHDIDAYARYVERVRRAGVTLPVVAGIMPALSKDAIIRMTLSNGCSIPAELAALIGRYDKDPDGFRAAGKAFTVKQIRGFAEAGANGLHIYTLNKYDDVAEILDESGILKRI